MASASPSAPRSTATTSACRAALRRCRAAPATTAASTAIHRRRWPAPAYLRLRVIDAGGGVRSKPRQVRAGQGARQADAVAVLRQGVVSVAARGAGADAARARLGQGASRGLRILRVGSVDDLVQVVAVDVALLVDAVRARAR